MEIVLHIANLQNVRVNCASVWVRVVGNCWRNSQRAPIFTPIPRCSHPTTHTAVLWKPVCFPCNTSLFIFCAILACVFPTVFPVQYSPDGCCVCRNPHLAIWTPAAEIDRKGGAAKISTQILQPRFLMLIPALGFLMKSRSDTDRPIEMGRSLWRRLEAGNIIGWHCELTRQRIAFWPVFGILLQGDGLDFTR